MYERGGLRWSFKNRRSPVSFFLDMGEKEKCGFGGGWGGGSRPVNANSGRMRKSRLCRLCGLREYERRASARRMFD